MSALEDLKREPYRHDFFMAMRRIEASLAAIVPDGPEDLRHPRPRLGDSATRRDETVAVDGAGYLVSIGQDPYLNFPSCNINSVTQERQTPADERATTEDPVNQNRIRFIVKFLGLTGPQGALPLAITEEAVGYLHNRDDAFARFLDLFNQRFLQLFYRAWADSRPIAQHDRPDDDRFRAYVGSAIGIGSPPFLGLDTVPDAAKAGFAGLLGPQAKSASRLRKALRGFFNVQVEIDEFIGEWLEIDESERSLLGGRNSGLGTEMLVGKAAYSVQDKIRIRIFVRDMRQYQRFLPQGDACRQLIDFIFFYAGDEVSWDLELALPAKYAKGSMLGGDGALGWTSWMAPNYPDPESFRCDARFAPAERLGHERRMAALAAQGGKATSNKPNGEQGHG